MAAIIPLGPGSLRDSSSLPEGRGASLRRTIRVRAGPALPSYLALLHAGFAMPRTLPPGRWALTPPFHPYQMRSIETGMPLVLPRACRRDRAHRRYILCGTFRSRRRRALSRVAKTTPWCYQARRPTLPDLAAEELGVRTFLPSFRLRKTNRRSPDPSANPIIPLRFTPKEDKCRLCLCSGRLYGRLLASRANHAASVWRYGARRAFFDVPPTSATPKSRTHPE